MSLRVEANNLNRQALTNKRQATADNNNQKAAEFLSDLFPVHGNILIDNSTKAENHAPNQ
jgi:hypothetical protein